MQTFYAKQAASEVKDWTMDFTAALGGDTIVSAALSATSAQTAAALALSDQSNTSTAVTVWLSGGAPGATYIVHYLVTTAAGRKIEGDLSIFITPS